MQKSRRKALLGRQNRKAEQEGRTGRRNWETELGDGIGNMALF